MREDPETADFRNVTRDRILQEEISIFEQELCNERKRGTYGLSRTSLWSTYQQVSLRIQIFPRRHSRREATLILLWNEPMPGRGI